MKRTPLVPAALFLALVLSQGPFAAGPGAGPAALAAEGTAVQLRDKDWEPAPPQQAAQPQPTQAPKPPAKPDARPDPRQVDRRADKRADKRARQAKAPRESQAEALLGRQAAGQPRISTGELATPYSASPRFMGPPAPPKDKDDAAQAGQAPQAAQANATGPYDPTPKKGPFAKQDPDSPINFRFGRARVTDPITGREMTKTDPTGAKDSLKSGDVKGAADKLGGKAEIQVDILKF